MNMLRFNYKNYSLVNSLLRETYLCCTRQVSNLQPYDPKSYTAHGTLVYSKRRSGFVGDDS